MNVFKDCIRLSGPMKLHLRGPDRAAWAARIPTKIHSGGTLGALPDGDLTAPR
jgi:hypothetical protein